MKEFEKNKGLHRQQHDTTTASLQVHQQKMTKDIFFQIIGISIFKHLFPDFSELHDILLFSMLMTKTMKCMKV